MYGWSDAECDQRTWHLRLVGLQDAAGPSGAAYSKGMRQRVKQRKPRRTIRKWSSWTSR